ncbi:AAA family ATPase [Enterococcus sp. DIV0242_7C1]|uniref:DNA topology modulation protein FlaR n=2 Tax=Enterococcus TaxID=1350 RepID=A0A200JEV2_9ENTE|nr:AAA family ATPase [Enterococcus sp. DIV0242_7C1]OUZ35411.1 hypothetical protein A5889_000887 [Enterococcus sp. 9D6_DIV0238]
MMKIVIAGPVGSGKTTFARELAKEQKVQLYELDNLIWQRTPQGDQRFSKEKSAQLLQDILNYPEWIIEGTTTQSWIQDALIQADSVLLLLPPYHIRLYRILKRFIKQKLQLERANYTPTMNLLKMMFVWNHHYETKNKLELQQLIATSPAKLHILKDRNAYSAYKKMIET